ncbi:hypothetical protein TPB0596_10770 [Tsukamurella pulmonis]|nr:hypothetical protein TPB0596_10770 [Tsukamurella pulmonis]
MSHTYDDDMSEPQRPTESIGPAASAPLSVSPPFAAAPPGPPAPPVPEPRWSSAQKLAFRLLFVIGGGFLVLSIYGNLGLSILWYFSGIFWTLAQIGSYLTRGQGVDVFLSNNGDPLWVWCWHLGWIVVSLVIVAIWTFLDGARPNYRSLLGLLGVFARVGLALTMIKYGLIKVLPTQMGFMILPTYQMQLTGDTSLFNTLWGFMGASTWYSVATGLVEVAAGVLLLWKRTSLLGALLAVVAAAQIFLLNFFYDVPVKIVATEQLLIALALTTRYWPNLLDVGLNRPVRGPVTDLPVAGARRSGLRITGVTVKYVFAAYLVMAGVGNGILGVYIIHTPRTPLDGEWRATSFTIDGAPAGLTQRDPAPWSTLAITMRGSDSPAIKPVAESYDSVVTQEPSGYITSWLLEAKGDVLELRKRKGDAPLLLTTRVDGDTLHLSATVNGKRIEGDYARRFMERDRSHFRLVQPDGATDPLPGQGGS